MDSKLSGIYSDLAVGEVNRADSRLQKAYELISSYCLDNYSFKSEFKNKVRLHEPTFDQDEILDALDVLLSTRVTMGPIVKNFEKKFLTKYFYGNAITNNSGSSANLLAIAALSNPDYRNHLKPGDEVIVPALSWSTTVWPLVQHNLVPVIVDIDLNTLNISIDSIKKAISKKTKAIMPVHVYGNPCDMDALTTICKEYGLMLIEDCCEALGASYKDAYVGSFGEVGTFSFYFSHHVTTLEGGMTVTKDDDLAELMRILRAHGWVRDMHNPNDYLQKYSNIDPRFLFVNMGYNLRITELQGAIGLRQLDKLSNFVDARRQNTRFFNNALKAKYNKSFSFQEEQVNGKSSNFGYPILLNKGVNFTVQEITKYLGDHGIETRPIICGNIARQPAISKFNHRISGDLGNADLVMDRGFSWGNHQFINNDARQYILDVIDKFMSKNNV